MTGPARARKSSLPLAIVAVCGALLAFACGPDYYEIPIETPIQPKMDVSPFQRVLVVGFVAGGSEERGGAGERETTAFPCRHSSGH